MLNCEKRACPKRSPSVRVQSSTALLRPLVWFRNRVVTRVLGIVRNRRNRAVCPRTPLCVPRPPRPRIHVRWPGTAQHHKGLHATSNRRLIVSPGNPRSPRYAASWPPPGSVYRRASVGILDVGRFACGTIRPLALVRRATRRCTRNGRALCKACLGGSARGRSRRRLGTFPHRADMANTSYPRGATNAYTGKRARRITTK